MSFQGALGPGPRWASEARSLHVRGTTAVAPQEEGRSLGKGHPGGWAGPGEGSPLDALQRVVHVAALPLHKGFAQAAGVSVDLTAPVFTDVICGVSVGEKGMGEGKREGKRSTSLE